MPTKTPDKIQAKTRKGAQQGKYTDIKLNGIWGLLPVRLQTYVALARLDRPIGWWLLVLPGWWIFAAFSPSPHIAIFYMTLFTIGAVAMRGAGCIINDLWDRDIDAQVERTRSRPLASGQISVTAAVLFLGCLSGCGLLVLIQLPMFSWAVGISALPLIILYPLAKRFTDWPQIVLGLTFSWAIPVAGAVLWQGWPPASLWILYAGTVFWVIGYDTIYAVQDMKDDRLTGVRSAALSLGRYLRFGVGACYLFASLLWAAGFFSLLGQGVWIIGLSLVCCHFLWQLRRLVADNPAIALQIFKSNRDAGLILTASLFLGSFLN